MCFLLTGVGPSNHDLSAINTSYISCRAVKCFTVPRMTSKKSRIARHSGVDDGEVAYEGIYIEVI